MFNPFGLSMPNLNINFLSLCLWSPMMSSRECKAELKCSVTENPRDRFRTLPAKVLADITVCGLKQCSGGNISQKQHDMALIEFDVSYAS